MLSTVQKVGCYHWRRLVKKIGWDCGKTKILWGQKVTKRDKCMSDSELLGNARARAAPKVYAYGLNCFYAS